MSQENVEVVRRLLDAFGRRDYYEATRCLHEDAEWHNTASFPGPRTVTGSRAISEFWDTLVESFDESEGGSEIEKVAVGSDRVVVGIRTQGRGAGSGVPIDVRYGLGFSLKEGRIRRVDVSGSYGKALEAAGLSE
jgi:ketosteroid isomerase-like protein